MNNLLVRAVAIGIIAILSFAAVAITVIGFGMQGILADWETGNNQLLTRTVTERLEAIAKIPDAKGLEQSQLSALIMDRMQGLPLRPEYVVVLDQQDNIVFLNHMGDSPPGGGFNLVRKLLQTAPWQAIPAGGQPWLRFAARVLPFDADESNRLLFSAIQKTAVWGALIASLIAFVIAWLMSRPLSRQARALAESLAALQAGHRDAAVPTGGVRELALIAQTTRELQDSLTREESTRQQWAADIAHDLRTPLTVLKGQFEGMLDGVFQADQPRLKRNYQEILQLERLISQLAELTKLETPGFRVEPQAINAAEALLALAERFGDQARMRSCQIDVAADGTEPILAHADLALLDRALSNLLDNALRYGQSPDRIRLEARRDGASGIRFSIENGGVIPSAQLPFLFNRLYRSDQSRNTPGSGLGLAIVKAIAIAHRGKVSVECDESTQRTRFSLYLPD